MARHDGSFGQRRVGGDHGQGGGDALVGDVEHADGDVVGVWTGDGEVAGELGGGLDAGFEVIRRIRVVVDPGSG